MSQEPSPETQPHEPSGEDTQVSKARTGSDPIGPVAWMTKNSVAANLFMFVIVLGGIMGVLSLKQEVFPEFELDQISVSVPYPGASPAEVEQGIVLAIEEAVRGLDGVKRVNSSASENAGTTTVELLLNADAEKVLSDVKNAIDRIQTFPEQAEEPTVAITSPKRPVISLVIAGEHDPRTLHDMAERARAQLLQSDEITQVELFGVRPLEISIEVSRENLEAYGLTLDHVARQIRAASIELPGGGLDTSSGELLVRVTDRRLQGQQFADIIVHSTEAGHEIRLGDIATVTDGYADTDEVSYFNGKPAVRITAYRVGDETPIAVSKAVRSYADQLRTELPKNVEVAVWNDDSEMLKGRIDLLVRNAQMGLLLVLIVLALFLQRRLAFWVAVGIPISFLGALFLMGPLDASINMVTLFALIVTLGMVVDDAIIVAENIHTRTVEGLPPMRAAILGAKEMIVPVTFSILTTIAAFAPLLFVPGVMGKIMRLIPVVVIAVLLFSLLESFFVLPAHLSHGKSNNAIVRAITFVLNLAFSFLDPIQKRVSAGLEWFTSNGYQPFLKFLLRYRYAVLAMGMATLMITVSAVKAGLVPFSFFPKLEGDLVTATARLPYGTPVERTDAISETMRLAAQEAIEQSGGSSITRGIFTQVGQTPTPRGPHGALASRGSHLTSIQVGLVPSEQRDFSSQDFVGRWRERLPPLPGVEALTISGSIGPGAGAAVDVQLSHHSSKVLAQASEELAQKLREFPSLADIENTYAGGKPQLDFTLRRQARTLGLTSADVGRTLRSSFFGNEALREQRGRNEIKVMVRLPEHQRDSEHDLEKLLIATPAGGFVPLGHVADFRRGRAATEINREESRRTVNVSGELAAGVKSPREVLDALNAEVLPELKAKYPDLETTLVGQQREQNESFASLGRNFLFALFVIFTLLAVPFRSYVQPLIVMSAIPFGIVGAVIGHVVMGYELSFISVLGIIALSGVVVNDSLVLIDATNRYQREGATPFDAIVRGGMRRMRPILLTSLTTFFGLMPMIFETSPQARFLIPMAISLGFGALFVTFIVLLLVPALYLIVEDLRGGMSRLNTATTAAPQATQASNAE